MFSPCTSIEYYANSNYKCTLYPNPNNGELNLAITKINPDMKIEVYSILGELILSEKVVAEQSHLKLVAKPGTYIIKVTENNQLIYRASMIKQ